MGHEIAQPKVETYASYGTYYTDYGKYPSKDANMGKKMARRHTMNTHEDMMPENRDEDAMMQKRDMPPTTDTGDRKAPHETLPTGDNKYHAYE